MNLEQAAGHWRKHGYALLPGLLSQDDIDSAQEALSAVFPTADEFHDDVDPVRNAPFRDEFGGILEFPWAAVELCLLAVHPRLVELAEAVLATTDLRLYSAEAWAKYTGAAEYDQELHRDYLNHTPLVPTSDPRFSQLEMFVWLSDVTEAHGPTHVVSRERTTHVPAWPNWLSKPDVPDLYEAEVSAAGPAGTVLAYSPATFHRGTAMTPHVAPAIPCTSTIGPPPRSGRTGTVGLLGRRRSGPDGTSSSKRLQHVSSASSGFRLPGIRTGPRRRWLGWRSATTGWTSPPGETPLPTLRFDAFDGASRHRRCGRPKRPNRGGIVGHPSPR